jgi:hypothetical protein
MKNFVQIQHSSKMSIFKVNVLKTMMYCGVLWGLYHPDHHGWAIHKIDHEHIFPFWLNSVQALQYAKVHWPNYKPRKINADDFQNFLLPTLKRFEVVPALCHKKDKLLKISISHMQLLFFKHHLATAN